MGPCRRARGRLCGWPGQLARPGTRHAHRRRGRGDRAHAAPVRGGLWHRHRKRVAVSLGPLRVWHQRGLYRTGCRSRAASLRVPLKRDLNGDGIVTAEENAEVDELSRKVRRRIIVGTVIFAIPCIVMTAGSIGSAQAGVQDGYGVTETTRELAAVLPGFKDYTVAVETSATEGEEEGIVEREVVAHVTTSEALGAHDRRVARKLIDLNVPELDRVEFDVQ